MILANWTEKKVKYLFNLINGGTPRSNIEEYWNKKEVVWFTPEDLSKPGQTIEDSIRKISKTGLKNSSAQLVQEGSIVLSTRAPIGNIKISDVPFTTNQGCKSLQIKDNTNDVRFFYYWLYVHTEYLQHLGRGTTFLELSNHDLKNLKINIPSVIEQTNIANFLDLKSLEIDTLILAKEELIELLEEKRQAIITETVTKGLDPNVKMKDSGIEWIGEIPEHWEVKKLKYLMQLNPPKSEVNKKNEMRVTFLPMEKLLSNGEVDCSVSRPIDDVYAGYTYFRDNDIVMAKVTPCFENGNIALMEGLENGVGFGTTELHVLRANQKIKEKYLYYLLRTEYFKQEGVSTMYGVGGLKRIPAQFILDYKIGLPSEKEQEEILQHIEMINEDIDVLIEKQHEVIIKLKEYRESLIYEAVTGKIDLRDYEEETDED